MNVEPFPISRHVAWHQRAHSTARGRNGRRRVLIADDSADSREWLALLLKMSGHEVHVARDGAEAIEIAEDVQPEVVFLDLEMPRASGFEVCARLRASSWAMHIPIYAITAFSNADHVRLAREAGFDAHLTKPLDPEVLPRLV